MVDDPSDELIFPRSTAATPQSVGPAQQQADPGLIKKQMAEAASAAARHGNAIPEHELWEKAYKGMKLAALPTLWSHISKGNADGGYFSKLGKKLQSTTWYRWVDKD
jgi:hypothetical protein